MVGSKGALCEYILPLNDGTLSRSESREGHTSASSQRLTSPPDNGIVHDEIKGMITQREKGVYQLMREFGVTKGPANRAVISLGKFKAQAVIHFRRALYHAGILVQNAPNPDFNQTASAEFLRRNPGYSDRLIPWLKRELKVLCGNQRPKIQSLQSFILNNMTQHDLWSKEFEALLQPHLHRFTNQFLHEFISFVLSPLSLKKYDWNALYECPSLMGEDSDSLISSASSDEDCSLLPPDDQVSKADNNVEDGNPGCFHSSSGKETMAVSTTADDHIHLNEEGNHLEDLSNSESEKGKQTGDDLGKNRRSQLLQYIKKNETIDAGASKSSLNILGSEDYEAFSFTHSYADKITNMPHGTKGETTMWQQVDSPIRHLKDSSSERHLVLCPRRKRVLKSNGSRVMKCNLEEGYPAPKARRGGRSRRRHPREEKQYIKCSRDRRCRREHRRSRSRDVSLFRRSPGPLRSENIVAKDISKSKSHNTHQFRKIRSKDYDGLRNRSSSEPNWRYLYYQQDYERYRLEDPLYIKGEPTRAYGPKPLAGSRETFCFLPENKSWINQENLVKGWYHCAERCRTTGRPRGRFAATGQEMGPYDKLGGKRRHHMEPGYSSGELRSFQDNMHS
ncbi:E3 ubiquitin-protein ligase Topors [Varanus komodoensis]|nr:E3 ubiquitin-protein ligase Topors [Varanus komodoensis]